MLIKIDILGLGLSIYWRVEGMRGHSKIERRKIRVEKHFKSFKFLI